MRRILLRGHDAIIHDFVTRLSPLERPVFQEGDAAFGVLRGDGRLIAGIVFSGWRPQFGTLEISAAAVSSACLSTQIVLELGEYAFGQLSAFRVSARTALGNERAKKMLRHIGFLPESVQAHYYGEGKHASCWRLIKPEWERKWLSLRGQKAA